MKLSLISVSVAALLAVSVSAQASSSKTVILPGDARDIELIAVQLKKVSTGRTTSSREVCERDDGPDRCHTETTYGKVEMVEVTVSYSSKEESRYDHSDEGYTNENDVTV